MSVPVYGEVKPVNPQADPRGFFISFSGLRVRISDAQQGVIEGRMLYSSPVENEGLYEVEREDGRRVSLQFSNLRKFEINTSPEIKFDS